MATRKSKRKPRELTIMDLQRMAQILGCRLQVSIEPAEHRKFWPCTTVSTSDVMRYTFTKPKGQDGDE